MNDAEAEDADWNGFRMIFAEAPLIGGLRGAAEEIPGIICVDLAAETAPLVAVLAVRLDG